MRKLLLSTVSVLGLGLAGVAFAAGQGQQAGQADPVPATQAEAEAGTPALESSYRSFQQTDASVSGPVAAGMTADEIMGREVVDENGDKVGTVHDLLLGDDDLVRAILIDTGAAAGGGSPQYVAVLVAHVLEEQGDGGNLVVNVNPDELQQLPAWEQQGDTWTQAS